MPTINPKDIIIGLIKNNGHYCDDPQVYSIHSYTNNWDSKTYHISYDESTENSLYRSPNVHSPILLWSRSIGITSEGKKLIEEEDKA